VSNKRWLGQAAAVFDLWTVSLSGTVISQTYTMTINAKTITYTASGADTVNTILTALAAAWNAIAPAPAPEFQELTATPLPAGGPYTSMTLTQDVAGRPSTITVSTSGAATFSIANTTPATGPSFFDNAQNWVGGVAPVNSDYLIFDNGSVPCCYNINTSLTGITIDIEPGYSGTIGLPLINATGSTWYNEYRTTNLTLAGGTVIINGPSVRRVNLAFGANTANVRVLATGSRFDSYIPVVLLTGGNGSSELDITKGDVSPAFFTGTSATFPTIKTSFASSAKNDVTLTCGAGAVLTTITKNGGKLLVNSNVTTLTQGPAGGTTEIDAGAITTLNVQGGTVAYNSVGTLGTATVYGGGVLTFDGDPRAKTVTNPVNLTGPHTLIDNQKVVNSGVLSFVSAGVAPNVQHGISNTGSLT